MNHSDLIAKTNKRIRVALALLTQVSLLFLTTNTFANPELRPEIRILYFDRQTRDAAKQYYGSEVPVPMLMREMLVRVQKKLASMKNPPLTVIYDLTFAKRDASYADVTTRLAAAFKSSPFPLVIGIEEVEREDSPYEIEPLIYDSVKRISHVHFWLDGNQNFFIPNRFGFCEVAPSIHPFQNKYMPMSVSGMGAVIESLDPSKKAQSLGMAYQLFSLLGSVSPTKRTAKSVDCPNKTELTYFGAAVPFRSFPSESISTFLQGDIKKESLKKNSIVFIAENVVDVHKIFRDKEPLPGVYIHALTLDSMLNLYLKK